MKKHLILLAFVCGLAFTANAQFFQMGLKLQYSSQGIDELKNNVTTAIEDKSAEFINQCDAGLLVRLNIGRWLTIQPEANFSISAVQDSTNTGGSFFDQASYAFSNIETVNLKVPVLVALNLLKIENTLSLRLFAGPEFYTSIGNAENIDFSNYSILAGASVDLINIFNVDVRVTKPMKEGDLFYTVGVGLLF